MAQLDIFGNLQFQKVKTSRPPKIETVPNLSCFKHDNGPVYIGQNLYIRPNYIVSMPEYSSPKRLDSEAFIKNKVNLKDKSHKGKVSVKAMKEIKNSVNWLIHASKYKEIWHKESKRTYRFKVNFITLTLPDTTSVVTDQLFKKELLEPLLATLRKGYGLRNYVWKLEYQANGKLHAHLTTDTFIYWKDLRRLWNKRLISSGYMVKFKDQFGHTNPNSTDVHAVKKVKDLAAYISKYMAKDSDKLANCKGRIWGCNYEISRSRKPSVFIDRHSSDDSIRSMFNKLIHWSPLKLTNPKTNLEKTIGEIFFLDQSLWVSQIKGILRKTYDDVINYLRGPSNFLELNPVVVSPA